MTGEGPWAFLPPTFRKSIDRLGFAKPTPVQAACLPKAMAGESFRAIAPTGTGKTLVYMLPAWRLAIQGKSAHGGASTLILLPTRELAYQVSQMLQALEPALRDDVALAIGGHPKESQLQRIRAGWRILVATPGRLLEMLEERSVTLKAVTLTVLDEFDKLIGMGFEEQIAAILKRVPNGGQRLLLSATDQDAPAVDAHEAGPSAGESQSETGSIGNADPSGSATGVGSKGAKRTASEKLSGAAKSMGLSDLPLIPVEREAGSRRMEEAFYFLKSNKKKSDLLLLELSGSKGQAIVFVSNREKANHLNGLLKLRGIDVRVLHGHLPQEERANAYQDFRGGRFKVLVATDLASRGLDMPEVELIVNYDLPKHYKDYVHRTGRTARQGRAGRCVSFAGPDEYLPMRNLEKEFPGELPIHPAFAQRDRWFVDAKRNHDALVKLEERKDRIRREQGLSD